MKIILILASILYVRGNTLPPPYTEHCIVGEKNLYPPPSNTTVPTYVVDLDRAPQERWNEVAAVYGHKIKDLVEVKYRSNFFRVLHEQIPFRE